MRPFQFCQSPRPPVRQPNLCRYAVCAKSCIGHHHQMEYAMPAIRKSAHNNRGNASRFEDGKLPKLLRIKCHAPSLAAVQRKL